ncbi:MAG: bifunctional proline dehydrogenase/L-glutamate gamma-semialdehyde dehydrogenase PutA, partial [Gammaproteobacteria bacterium]|nr:bifunctional proline dehydrogenase/L-glutamate gamma-semialdehyde dehydrogenase PutA [Gammaproteobacteria bacterium]
GAYWDSEIKWAQERGWSSYPVFTRKVWTDLNYLHCAQKLLAAPHAFHAKFASHNAHTVSSILEMADGRRDFEFQRLHGMGEHLYEEVVPEEKWGVPCRVYAPVGAHEELLPYLVRRLLENGANTSFVHRIADEDIPVEQVVRDPITLAETFDSIPHPKIPLPESMYGDERKNSSGINWYSANAIQSLANGLSTATTITRRASPLISGRTVEVGEENDSTNPATGDTVGSVIRANAELVDEAAVAALAAFRDWDALSGTRRGEILWRASDLYEAHAAELIYLCVNEAGKSLPDSYSELREAVDFLRYYGAQAAREFSSPVELPGPTGERNQLSLRGRGVFGCISPWNFPLAIFTGQVSAALAAGNCVLTKPAEQTSLVGARAVELLHEAGVPSNVLHLLPGQGSVVGQAMVEHRNVSGIAFTGSTATARQINQSLAAKEGPIPVLIAETGGQNAMLVDSSALPEQVVNDVVQSAFNSAGQRCSALRVLFLQNSIADRVIELLTGAMQELVIGNPASLATDIGPVIDETALAGLIVHRDYLQRVGKIIHQCENPTDLNDGWFFPPLLVEIDSIDQLEDEVFGPILHIVRYARKDTEKVIEAINNTGYGLTFGVHSRIDARARWLASQVRAGNAYVNRNMIGAVVGVQPFGGCNLSGTGPKAGGPHYLHRFANEHTYTVNTSAVGGNASLLALSND